MRREGEQAEWLEMEVGWEINEGLALRVAAGLVHWVASCTYRVGG